MLLVKPVKRHCAYHSHYKVKFGYWKRRGINGPLAIPVFGTLLDENFTAKAGDIDEKYLKKFGRVFGTYAGTTPIFNTSVPEHIKQVLKETDVFYQTKTFEVHDEFIRHSIIFRNGATWKAHRTAASHHFTSSKLRSLMHHFEGVTSNFINNVEELNQNGEKINVKPLLKCYGSKAFSRLFFKFNSSKP